MRTLLELPGVTLCCIDTANHALALRALLRSRAAVRFARTLLLTAALPDDLAVPEGIAVIPIAPITSRDQYSQLVLKALLPHIATPHVLLVQWDGYVVNPEAWDPAFLACDYIGAVWQWHADGMRVGNGGFSLRSRRLLDALQDPRIVLAGAEDETICRAFRPLLERDHGIRFAEEQVADRFAFEAAYPVGRPFGFHGLFNFCRVVPPDELAALAPGFSDAIARSPQLAQLLRNCVAMAQWPAAAAIARRVLATQPESDEARRLLAQAEANVARGAAAGRNDPCPCGSGRRFKHCHGAVAANPPAAANRASPPPSSDAIVAGAIAAHQRGDLAAAERGYRAALAATPDHPHALHFLGVVLYQHHRLAEALPLLERAAGLVPQEPEFHNNLGLALAAADRADDAIGAYRRSLALKPDHATAWNNLGLALQADNRLGDAAAAFRAAIAHAPSFAEARWNLSLALLGQQLSAEAWHAYESRLSIPALWKAEHMHPGPRWDGVVRPGITLLVTAEQGLGDTLQFIRFVQPLAARGARVIVAAPAPLVRLVGTVPGVAASFRHDAALPHYDAQIPLLSLPQVLDITEHDLQSAVPYITADAARRAPVAAALATRTGVRRIGLAWAGDPGHRNDRRRSIPLATLAPLLALPDVEWFSLQQGEAAKAIRELPAAGVLRALPPDNDFDDTAALVAELDLVICVDTSMAHLAGALARPVWVMLAYAADWRWQLRRADSPWYPTARLFRQPRVGDWDPVVREVQEALRAAEASSR
jgi:tetratricopeptide (TPR) repeat protein